MHTSRIRPWIVISLTFLFARAVYAESVVESEYEWKVPKGFQQRIIDKEWNRLQHEEFTRTFTFPDQNFKAVDTDVALAGIQLDVRTQLRKPGLTKPPPAPTSVPVLVLESKNMSAHLRIQSVSVDQYIVREIGGVIGRFHLQARCENLDLEMKPDEGRLRLQLSPILEGSRISSQLEDMNLVWTENAWKLNPMSCTGAQGFEDVIREHVMNMTKNSDPFTQRKAELMALVQEYLNSKSIDLSRPEVASEGRPDITYALTVSGIESDEDQNLWLRGRVAVHFKNIKTSERVFLPLAKRSSGVSSQKAQLRVPEKLLEVLMERAFVPGTWQDRVGSEKVPGFESFMSNRFIQCLLWPDLKHYSEDARFLFDLGSRTPVVADGRGLNYKVNIVLDAKMWAPKNVSGKTRYVPFMMFQLPLESQVQLSLGQGVLSAAFSNVNLSLQGEWLASYVRDYRPNQNFYPETLTPRLRKAAEGSRVNFKIPSFALTKDLSLQITDARVAPGNGDLVFLMSAF